MSRKEELVNDHLCTTEGESRFSWSQVCINITASPLINVLAFTIFVAARMQKSIC